MAYLIMREQLNFAYNRVYILVMPTTILINLQIAGCLDILVLYDTEVKNDGEKKKLSELVCLEFKIFL